MMDTTPILILNNFTKSFDDFDTTPNWLNLFRPCVTYILLGISVLGSLTTLWVLIQLVVILKQKRREASNWVLTTVCTADLLCLLSLGLFSYVGTCIFNLPHYWNGLKHVFCKLCIYLTHTTSACSIWCWVVLSFLRYFAVAHPITFFSNPKFHKTPTILSLTVLVCATAELWIFVLVHYDAEETMGCNLIPGVSHGFAKGMMLAETFFAYIIPAILIFVLDLIVLNRSHHKSPAITNVRVRATSSEQNTVQMTTLVKSECGGTRQNREKKRPVSPSTARKLNFLKKYLLLTTLDLVLNIPNVILNLMSGFVHESVLYNNPLVELLIEVGNMMYYSQFFINVLYLWVLIVQEPQKPPNQDIVAKEHDLIAPKPKSECVPSAIVSQELESHFAMDHDESDKKEFVSVV